MSYWWNQPQPEVVLGGIPLLRASHFRDNWNEDWNDTEFSSWNAPSDLERLQRLLYEQTKGKEQNDSVDDVEDEEEENSIVLVSKYQPYRYNKRTRNNKIPYHEDILPRWEGTLTCHMLCFIVFCFDIWYGITEDMPSVDGV